MITIIAGGRRITRYQFSQAIHVLEMSHITRGISGRARGADRCGERWFDSQGIEWDGYLPDYATHGRRAPLVRNTLMAEKAQALVAVWDGHSNGTRHMIREASKRGLYVQVAVPRGCVWRRWVPQGEKLVLSPLKQ